MIHSYNRSQTIKAVLLISGGVFYSWLAYLFFAYSGVFLDHQFRLQIPEIMHVCIGLAGLAGIWITGYRVWKSGGGLYSYHDSALYHNFGRASGGSFMLEMYAHRVTGTAYILSQIFLAGPLWILKAASLLYGLIPYSSQLEAKLEQTLAILRAANKWQGLGEYPTALKEILHLAQMGLIDFSAFKGAPRFKAR
jgi:hypothetical protein